MQQYNPFQWPADKGLAQLHYNCSKPGTEDMNGKICPCCNNYQRIKKQKWRQRDIDKDFNNLGGAIPAYFKLLLYFIICLIVLALIKTIYQIILLRKVCPSLKGTQSQCIDMFQIFQFCSSKAMYDQLSKMNQQNYADVMQILQIVIYVMLVTMTVLIRHFLLQFNKKINKDKKIFSRFGLIIKNLPQGMSKQKLQEQLKLRVNSIQVQQMFHIHKTCQLQYQYRKLCDLYFQIKCLQENYQILQIEGQQKLKKSKQLFIQIYQRYQNSLKIIEQKSRKIIVVFKKQKDKQKIYRQFKKDKITKFLFNFSAMANCQPKDIGYYVQHLSQPQQIYWKYIGQNSSQKLKSKFYTTIIGFGLILLSFVIFYFPMLKINQVKDSNPTIGIILGYILSATVIFMSVFYRIILIKLIPKRKPSSKLAQSHFIVISTILFHFFFYLFFPAAFYLLDTKVSSQKKIKIIFFAVVGFILMAMFVAFIDVRYRLFKRKRQKLLKDNSFITLGMYQGKLNQQINPPTFPIQFKMMLILNIWMFNGFYIFQIPYVIFFFVFIVIVLYWVDKRNVYTHYKLQHYLSLDLHLKVQKTYLPLFLISLSIGYFISSRFMWQIYLILIINCIAILVSYLFDKRVSSVQYNVQNPKQNIQNALQQIRENPSVTKHLQAQQNQMRRTFLIKKQIKQNISCESFGYEQAYNMFLNQFKNKQMNQRLIKKYKQIISRMQNSKNVQIQMIQAKSDLNKQNQIIEEQLSKSHKHQIKLNLLRQNN